jgi:hypothetical protein
MMLRAVGGSQTWRERGRAWLPLLAVAGLVCLLLFQAFVYYDKLTLSLGPRVILQPWLMQQGFVLYEDIADLHSPLMPLTLAAFRYVVPDGLQLAKLVLVALISLSTLLTFMAVRRTACWLGGLWAAWLFVVWSPTFDFGKLWHETFLTPLYALLLLCYDPCASRRSVGSSLFLGLIGGIALLTKQHSAVVILALLVWTAMANQHFNRPVLGNLRDLALVSLGVILPVLAFTVYQYVRAGTLAGFLYWTIGYTLTSDYGALAVQSPTLNQIHVLVGCFLLLFPALFYLVELKRKGDHTWLYFGWGLVLFAASSLTVYPRFELFHLQAVLPAVVWLSSLTLAQAWRSSGAGRPFVAGTALALSVFWLVWVGPAYLPLVGTEQPRRILEYSDLQPLASDLEQYIGPADSMYLFPDEEVTANLYYLMRHLPPRFWVFSYPWNMSDPLKSRILSILEEQPPEWVVYLPERQNFEQYAPEIVGYLQTHYRQEAELSWAQGRILLLRRSE